MWYSPYRRDGAPCSAWQFRQVHASRPEVLKAFARASPQHCSVAWNHAAHDSHCMPYSTTFRHIGHAFNSACRRLRRRGMLSRERGE